MCWKPGNSGGLGRGERAGWVGGGQCVVRSWAAPRRPRLPSPSPPAQLWLRRPSSDRALSWVKVEPPRALCHLHTLAPGQKGSGRGRPTGWVRAAASREGSVDSWSLLLEGFALGRGGCRSAAQHRGKLRFPQTFPDPHPSCSLGELGETQLLGTRKKGAFWKPHGATRVKKGSSLASDLFHTCHGEFSEKTGWKATFQL